MKPPTNSDIRPPELPKRLSDAPLTMLTDRAEINERLLARCDLSGRTAANVIFEQVVFRRASLARTNLNATRLTDVRAEVSDFSGADWRRVRLRRVAFVECRLVGVQWLEAHLEDVTFTGCNLESAVLAATVFKRARFDNCVLRGALLDHADLSGVILRGCDLTNTDLQGATLHGADLRGSIIEGLRIGAKDVQGAIIDPDQAVQIAGLLGLTSRHRASHTQYPVSSSSFQFHTRTPSQFDASARSAYNLFC